MTISNRIFISSVKTKSLFKLLTQQDRKDVEKVNVPQMVVSLCEKNDLYFSTILIPRLIEQIYII